MLNDIQRRIRRQFYFIRGGFWPKIDSTFAGKTKMIGTTYGGWCVLPELLNAQSIVYSFGLGEDISFDLGVIEQFDLSVFGFDPTSHSVHYIQGLELPDNFHFCEYGLAATDGDLKLFVPKDGNVSHSLVSTREQQQQISFPVKRLETIMAELGHANLDVLKMDIEGCEYEVLDDLLNSNIRPTQLLVEFHHKVLNMGLDKTRSYYDRLIEDGYRLFYLSDNGNEFCFCRTGLIS